MRWYRRLKPKTDSLFFRLMLGFLVIILLLILFTFYSFSTFWTNLRNEIIGQNTLSLQMTSDQLEEHMESLIHYMIVTSFSEENVSIEKDDTNYITASKIMKGLHASITNNFPYVENFILLYRTKEFALEKQRGVDASVLFSHFYYNTNYPYEFWLEQFSEQFLVKYLPAADFLERELTNVVLKPNKRQLIPMIIKHTLKPDNYFIVMIDSNKMFQQLLGTTQNPFYILDQDENVIFSRGQTADTRLPTFSGLDTDRKYIKVDKQYYFYTHSANTGLYYISAIPDQLISNQIASSNLSLTMMFIACVLLCIFVSVMVSKRLYDPVKEMVDSIGKLSGEESFSSTINEFNYIGDNIMKLIHTHREDRLNLDRKESLLKSYAYSNKFKNIHSNFIDASEFERNKPFITILNEVSFKKNKDNMPQDDRAVYFVKELINHAIAKRYPDSYTFQIEQNQILSLIFTTDKPDEIKQLAQDINSMLAHDNEQLFLTIALSSTYDTFDRFPECYEEVNALLKQRSFHDENEIVEAIGRSHPVVCWGPVEQQEFDARLKEGNARKIQPIIQRTLRNMERKQAIAADYHFFADTLINKTIRVLSTLNVNQLNVYNANPLHQQVKKVYTVCELELFLGQIVQLACKLIEEKKEINDPITGFACAYLEANYANPQITLDHVADKINITGGYLSTYFKEKTGINFNDYLNKVRIEKAKQLLEHTDDRIQDIATQVGYLNLSSFNRMFKKFTGVTPSELRQNKVIHG